MGIINPRPAIRRAEARNITGRLARHNELMIRLINEGVGRTQASKEAMRLLLKEETEELEKKRLPRLSFKQMAMRLGLKFTIGR